MIGLDTNVCLRLVIDDDPEQARRARTLVEARCSPGSPGYIAKVVACELVWVLRRRYKVPRERVVTILERLLGNPILTFEDEDTVWSALEMYRLRQCDFADGIVAAGNRARGCEATATFDERAAKLAVFFEP